jgi:hypothetical protein
MKNYISISYPTEHSGRFLDTRHLTLTEILKAFGINEINIKKWANEISDKLSEKMREAV